MAKKPLRQPQVPPGDRFIFFERLQGLVREAGDLSVYAVADRCGFSHQTVHKALIGPVMPSEQVVRAIVSSLGSAQKLADTMELHRSGLAEQLELKSMEVSSSPRGARRGGESADPRNQLVTLLRRAVERSSFKIAYWGAKVGMCRSKAYGVFSLTGGKLPSFQELEALAEELSFDYELAEDCRARAAELKASRRHAGGSG